jgi:hypothetical protein
MEILGKLFGSPSKVKIMRLFLLNPDQGFESKDVAERSRVSASSARKEISVLSSAGFLRKKSFIKEEIKKRGKKEFIQKKRVQGWFFNSDFEYKHSLKDLLIDAEFINRDSLAKKIKSLGKIKLAVVAGVFTRDPESRIDIMVVGDNLKRSSIDRFIKNLEAEIGKELAYAVFETQDFIYRSNMYDKLVRDVIDYPHDKLIDMGVLSQVAVSK